MKFEYDPEKSALNQKKHGVSLEEAKALWLAVRVEIQGRTEDEPRFLRIGKLKGRLHSCVYTVRQDVIRLISARRSRKEEEKIYEERIKDEETREKN